MPNEPRIDILEEIRALCACGPRTPTSEGERRAHEHVAARLRALGLAPEVEEFRCTSDIYGRIAAHAGLLAAAGTIGLAVPSLGTALSAATNLSLYGDLERRWEWLGRLFPHGPSRNVLARVPAAAAMRRRVVLMAHVDAGTEGPALFFEPSRARTSARLFRDKLGISPNPVQLLFWAGVAQTGLSAAAGAGLPTQLPVWALTQLQAFIALQLGRAALGPTVPGASDNASGVAVLLALADRLQREPLDRTEVWLVATGCEESGLGGASDLLARHAGELDRDRTLFVAVDTLGAGSLRYCTSEGFVRRIAYDPNAMHIKNVPGRKTDVSDATWIADLLAHGLIASSFVPPTPIQDMRTLMRTRKQLVRERAQHVLRIQKTLEDANVKFASVVSDITGTSGRAILHAIAKGETDPETLLALTTGRLHASREALTDALRGRIRSSHRFLIKLHLGQVATIEKAIAELDVEVGSVLEPFRAKVSRLMTMPGVSDVTAQVVVSEIGTDMTRFRTAGHLVSWAGLCPRNDESAGKRRSTRVRKGAPWLKTTLVQAAWAAARAKTGYLRAQFLRIKSRRGPKKAIIAVAASMLTAAYYMLRDDVDYRDLGDDYFDRADKAKAASRLVRRLHDLGYEVQIATG